MKEITEEARQSEREAMYYRYLEFASLVKAGSIQPHWMADGSSFWYAEGVPDNTVIYKVNPKANTKTPLFDTGRLRQALTPLLGHDPAYQGLPFEEFTFVDKGEKAVKFTVEKKEFILQLDNYTITLAPVLSEEEKSRLVPQIVRKSFPRITPDVLEVLSPDRRWFAGVSDYNLWLRSTYDGRSLQMTTDGVKDYEWDVEGAKWSPDGFKLAAKKVDSRMVPSIPIVHWLTQTQDVEWIHFSPAGAPLPKTELFVVDILSKPQLRIDTSQEKDQFISILGWRPDGSELLFIRMDREHKKLELLAANPTTGQIRVVLTETQKTFVGPPYVDTQFSTGNWSRVFAWVGDGKKFVWMSERDGWNHLYLYDIDGTLLRRLTEGAFPLEDIVTVDEKAEWVYFRAHAEKRLYDTHLYRVSLEGKRFTRLTEATGQHEIKFAPSKEFFLDTHSTVARPPVVELRRADGTLLQVLSRANIDGLKELKWSPPEEFVVKAADGKTDLYGVLFKPYDFDPNRKYPVIEHIYAGPGGTIVPNTFTSNPSRFINARALAQLGFITFIVDGRGTPRRGKEFQDVVYRNLGRHEIPDHVAALKQLAAERPYMDLSRVSIVGGPGQGGYFTIRALLLAPEVYHVGVAAAPGGVWGAGHEGVMGLPQNNKEGYEYANKLDLAANLKGKLLLIIGTSAAGAPFSLTMRMVEAFIRVGKPYDLIVLPEQNVWPSGTSRTYLLEAIRRYFQEHLKP